MKNKINLKIPVIIIAVLCCMTAIFFLYEKNVPQKLPQPKRIVQHTDGRELSLEEMVDNATHITDAEYIGYEVDEYGVARFKFKPVNTIMGTFDSDIIYAVTGEKLEEKCTEGKVYMIFLEQIDSVYSDVQQYGFIQPQKKQLTAEDDGWQKQHDDVKAILESNPQLYQNDGEEKTFTLSNDMDEILNCSAHIFKVRVDNVFTESTIAPTTVYECSVTATLKSKPVNDNGNLLINMFNDTVEVGKEYIVLLSDAQESAPVYTLSSRNSVYTPEEAEQIPQLKEFLSNAEEYTTVPDNKTNEEILAEEQAYIEEHGIE